MKFHLFLIVIFISNCALAFEVPKNFESQKDFTGSSQFWIDPKTLETISVSDEDVSRLDPSKNDFVEIKEIMAFKGEALSQILKIKGWKVTSSSQQTDSQGGQLIWFFGDYIDSGDELTYFAEVYELPKVSKPHAWLLTRTKSSWSEKEIKDRFEIAK